MSEVFESTDKQVKEHVQTYEGMLALFKWGTIGCIVVLIGMAVFLLPHR